MRERRRKEPYKETKLMQEATIVVNFGEKRVLQVSHLATNRPEHGKTSENN